MSLTQLEFIEGVEAALGRGETLREVVRAKTRQAVRIIERTVEPGFLYMQKFSSLTLSSSGDYPQIVDLPNARMKCILFFRLVDEDGGYTYLKNVEPKEVTSLSEGNPEGYWHLSQSKLCMDSVPEEDLNAEICWVEFSDWSASDDLTHWLLDNAEDLLFNQVLTMMAAWVRDAKMIETYQQGRNEAELSLNFAKIDLESTNMETAMKYS